MTQPSVASGLLRVTVTSGSRRVDLVLPGAIPVAELVPELARSVGLLDAATVYGGYRLVTQDGRILASDASLTIQGVADGGVLIVAAGVDDEPQRVYDDVVEAMADVVERELQPWSPAQGRRTALGAAAILLVLGALALVLPGESLLPGDAEALLAAYRDQPEAVIAALLVALGVVLARAQGEPEAGVAVSLMATPYAAVAGLLLAPGTLAPWTWPMADEFFGWPVACAGVGLLAVGLVSALSLQEGRALLIPAILVGAVLLAAGLLLQLVAIEPSIVFTVLMTLVVLAGSVFPWLALGVTGTRADQLYSLQDVSADPEDIDSQAVSRDARLGHEILLSVSATVGTLVILCAPLAVDRGVYGIALAMLCCLALMLRTRQYRTGGEVLVGLVCGVLGLVSVTLSMLLIHDEWRAGAAIALAVIGAILLLVTLVPSTPSVRRGRLGDIVESATLLALLPLMVVAIGLVSAVAG